MFSEGFHFFFPFLEATCSRTGTVACMQQVCALVASAQLAHSKLEAEPRIHNTLPHQCLLVLLTVCPALEEKRGK